MERIKSKFDEFVLDEALAFDANRMPDLENQQKAFDKMHQHVVPELIGDMGIIRLNSLKSPMFYRMQRGKDDPMTPRVLFKISEYESPEFGNVWVAYCSDKGFEPEMCVLTHALFFTEIEGELLITREYLY